MWRYFVGGAGALLLGLAAMFLFRGSAATEAKAPPVQPAMQAQAGQEEALPDEAPSATAKTREQKRFDRVDKDKNGIIAQDEYFLSRHKAFAKLDTNGDGRLTFEEWAVKGITRFGGADKDKSGTLTRAEFATTAVVRKAKPHPRCACGKPAPASKAPDEGDGEE